MKISFAAPSVPQSGMLAVGVGSDGKLTRAAAEVDKACGGMIKRAMSASAKFTGRLAEVLSVMAPPDLSVGGIVLVGLGDLKALDSLGLQRVGGTLVAHLNAVGEKAAAIRLDGLAAGKLSAAEAASAVADGANLRSYRFDRYRTTEKAEAKPSLAKLAVMTEEHAAAKKLFGVREKVADGVFLTRDLVTEPPNILYPESFAERCQALSKLGVEVEVLDEKQMKKLGMDALVAVGMGSARDSRLVVMQWNGAPKSKQQAPIAFVGKGVTFDTGGISLEPGAGMESMIWDMGGAGTVIGLMKALAGRKAKANVVGLVGLVENMPDGKAQRPGDIVTSMSGQTIEIHNTDAEGRLVLADVLWYCQERIKPRFIVDLATLTGAIIVSLAHEYAGLFSNNDELANRLFAAGAATGEKLWRMPLGDAFDKMINTDAADMKNIGGKGAGSTTAAQFLQRFVNKTPWAHLDIAGMAWSKEGAPTAPKGATGFGVRLLDRLVAEHYEG